MTKVEFFTAVTRGEMNDEMIKYGHGELAKDAAAKERRRNQPTKAQKENAPLRDFALSYLDEVAATAAELAAAYNMGKDEDKKVTSNKFTAVCGALVKEGLIKSEDVKSTAKSGGKCKQYSIVDDGE